MKELKILAFGIVCAIFSMNLSIKANAHNQAVNFENINQNLYTYLEKNVSTDSSILDTEQYNVFFSGEVHATQKNFDVQLDIIKNLSSKANLKYILAEDSFSNSYYINNYLQTGDIANLDKVFEAIGGTSANNTEHYEYLTKLYEFNKSLPTEKKLTYIGVDVEHQNKTTAKLLKELIENTNFYKNSKELQDALNLDNSQDLYDTAYVLYRDFFEKGNEQELKSELGENFWDFKYLIENIINTSESLHLWKERKYHEFASTRESALIENFKKVYEHFPNSKFYGQWGLEHAYLHGIENSPIYEENDDRLASYLNNSDESPVKDKVCSIAIVYFDSFQMNNKNGEPNSLDYSMLSDENKEITTSKFFAKNDITFFKLDGENSPFRNNLYYLPSQIASRVTTDYFQYMIIVKNSLACTMRLI